jgi:type III secretion system FlhB-like substrate exporter
METRDGKIPRVVGVSYENGEFAPVVVLKGGGDVAHAVLEDARRLPDSPPVVRDAALVDQLYRIPVDGNVGRELFPVMATLLAHVIQLDRQLTARNGDRP